MRFTMDKDQATLLLDHRDPCTPAPWRVLPSPPVPLPPMLAITLASMKYLPNLAFCKYPFGYRPLVGNINCVPHAG